MNRSARQIFCLLRSFHTELPSAERQDLKTISTLIPFLWDYRWRIGVALGLMALSKLANIGVPVLMKWLVDTLDTAAENPLATIPIALLVSYGLLRLATSFFSEMRNAVFAKAASRSVREISLKVFRHLHALSLRFHLDRKTGGVSRDLERGSRSTRQLLHYLIFSILPTIFEIVVVCAILVFNYSVWFAVITFAVVVVYFVYTYKVTTWRTRFRVQMNEMDSRANTSAIDSLINFETVKYFGNESFETRRYDQSLESWEAASIKSDTSLALLNVGQGLIIGTGLTAIMMLAASGVVNGSMTLGDFVLVNAFMIQLYLPLNFLGTVFREVRHCLTDMEKMFGLLEETQEVSEHIDATELNVGAGTISFRNVSFGYDADREILHDVSFDVAAGQKVAVVGASGAGKSTLSRLLFRFYDVAAGDVEIDKQDIRSVTLASLREAIGIVPQDTVLFNDTIEYNIRYGRPNANQAEIREAARLAHLDAFIESLPDGYQTPVGERGLKLSGGEKQRVAIARTLLKNPPILILDEATSQLDSQSEQAIQDALQIVAKNRTTLVIAHRLSTIVDANQILVLSDGKIIERGSHAELLEQQGQYEKMWRLQLDAPELVGKPPEVVFS